jgi:hypothetical protein
MRLTSDTYQVAFPIPGMDPQSIQVTALRNTITVARGLQRSSRGRQRRLGGGLLAPVEPPDRTAGGGRPGRLSANENERLTRDGRAAPMGEVLRRCCRTEPARGRSASSLGVVVTGGWPRRVSG